MQIDTVGVPDGKRGMSAIAQSTENGTLFASMLSSVLNESARSIGDFSNEEEQSGFLGGETSFLNSASDTSDMAKNMMLFLFAGMLFGESGIGIELMTALMGGGRDKAPLSFLPQTQTKEDISQETENIPTAFQASNLLAYTSMALGTAGAVPANAWETANPLLVSHVGERDPGTYRDVISQFGVETSERYRVNKKGEGDTYCNIFAWDVTRAMGAEIPHYINALSNEPASQGEAGSTEMDANAINDWLNTYGAKYGWTEVSPEQAQAYANAGMPAVTSWKNPGGHGHMQVVSPSENGAYDANRGVAIAQAGRHLYNYNYITSVYGQGTLPEVQYFAHI